MKIVVTGSLGHIGKPLSQELVRRGHSVTVITSNAERKKEIEQLGATAAVGDMEDVEFLASVFKGTDVVHAMVPPNNAVPDPMQRHITIGNCVATALEKSGVRRVVYVSSYGAHLASGTGLIKGHYHAEQELLKVKSLQGITFLRATYIYYNVYAYVNMIKSAGFIAANYGGDDRVVLVSPADIASAAVEELEADTTGVKVRYAASDERSCIEIAHEIGKLIGKTDLKWNIISSEQMQAGMEAVGLPAPVAANLVEMFYACHTGLLHEDYDKHKPTLGKVKLEDFAREFAVVYNK